MLLPPMKMLQLCLPTHTFLEVHDSLISGNLGRTTSIMTGEIQEGRFSVCNGWSVRGLETV